jgi:hypothetical protein
MSSNAFFHGWVAASTRAANAPVKLRHKRWKMFHKLMSMYPGPILAVLPLNNKFEVLKKWLGENREKIPNTFLSAMTAPCTTIGIGETHTAFVAVPVEYKTPSRAT